jgi:hypothetical protein
MFTSRFADHVLAPTGHGQPWFVSEPVALSARLIAAHPMPWDAAFAAIQICLGVGFLLPRLVRPALAASVVWSLGVWWLGEGLGGVAGGHADILTGAPGAVLLYAVLAIALWPPRGRAGTEDTALPRWLATGWAALWVGGAVLRFLPGQGSSTTIASEISANVGGGPAWLSQIDHSVAGAVSTMGPGLVVAWALVCLVIGLGGLRNGPVRSAAVGLGIICSLAFWLLGQSLGGLWSGVATDPNTGPLIVLMAFALAGIADAAPARGRHRKQRAAAPVKARSRARQSWSTVPAATGMSAVPRTHYALAGALDGSPGGESLRTEWGRPRDDSMPMPMPTPTPTPDTYTHTPASASR